MVGNLSCSARIATVLLAGLKHAMALRYLEANIPMLNSILAPLILDFQKSYDPQNKDLVWQGLSRQFRQFWKGTIIEGTGNTVLDAECDPIIRILDRHGKGNSKQSEAVAKAMIPQGAWRRMFNEFRSNKKLAM